MFCRKSAPRELGMWVFGYFCTRIRFILLQISVRLEFERTPCKDSLIVPERIPLKDKLPQSKLPLVRSVLLDKTLNKEGNREGKEGRRERRGNRVGKEVESI